MPKQSLTVLKFDHTRPPAAVNLRLLQRVRRAFSVLEPKDQTWVLNFIEDLCRRKAEYRREINAAQATGEKGGA